MSDNAQARYADCATGSNTERSVLAVVTGDKGYNDQKIRKLAQNHEIRPLIKHQPLIEHREFSHCSKRGMHDWTATAPIVET